MLSSEVLAQQRRFGVTFDSGSGISMASGQEDVVTRRTPIFLDAGVRTFVDTRPELAYAGAVRVEVDGRASVGVVARVEYSVPLTRTLTFRPQGGLNLFLAPFSMFGPELGFALRLALDPKAALVARGLIDGYLWGSDVPDDTALVMINGTLGLELLL
ncbi:MAG: hypothetical protein AAF550_00090 [Myxococcota bacterium]